MSVRQYQKNLRRKQKAERRARQDVERDLKKRTSCPDCDAEFGSAGRVLAHRPGPCACPADIYALTKRVLAARAAEFEASPTGMVRCRNCTRLHNDEAWATVVVEGRILWDGCDHCMEHYAQHITTLINLWRARWDEASRPELTVSTAHERFVAPFSAQAPQVKTPARNKKTIAEQADRYSLYQQSVQNVDHDVAMINEVFARFRPGIDPVNIREDFCGTGNMSAAWVGSSKTKRAWAVDLDPEPVEWGKRQIRTSRLSPSQMERLTFVMSDVLDPGLCPGKVPLVDAVLAQNFSYFIFKKRETLREYFRLVRDGLNDNGVLILDAFGGPDMLKPTIEETQNENFSYIWDQARFDPATNELLCHIHFKFADGSQAFKAFTYDWRYWTPQEIREVLTEAGFSRVAMLFDVADDDETTEYEERDSWYDDDSWVAYIVAIK
jgi:hypothetical protein